MFRFAYSADKPPKIGLFMGKISTFERVKSTIPCGIPTIGTIASP